MTLDEIEAVLNREQKLKARRVRCLNTPTPLIEAVGYLLDRGFQGNVMSGYVVLERIGFKQRFIPDPLSGYMRPYGAPRPELISDYRWFPIGELEPLSADEPEYMALDFDAFKNLKEEVHAQNVRDWLSHDR